MNTLVLIIIAVATIIIVPSLFIFGRKHHGANNDAEEEFLIKDINHEEPRQDENSENLEADEEITETPTEPVVEQEETPFVAPERPLDIIIPRINAEEAADLLGIDQAEFEELVDEDVIAQQEHENGQPMFLFDDVIEYSRARRLAADDTTVVAPDEESYADEVIAAEAEYEPFEKVDEEIDEEIDSAGPVVYPTPPELLAAGIEKPLLSFDEIAAAHAELGPEEPPFTFEEEPGDDRLFIDEHVPIDGNVVEEPHPDAITFEDEVVSETAIADEADVEEVPSVLIVEEGPYDVVIDDYVEEPFDTNVIADDLDRDDIEEMFHEEPFIALIDAEYAGDHNVRLLFSDGFVTTVDLYDYLEGSVFEPYRDTGAFSQVRYDDELGTIAWPNGADFAPEFLYMLAVQTNEEIIRDEVITPQSDEYDASLEEQTVALAKKRKAKKEKQKKKAKKAAAKKAAKKKIAKAEKKKEEKAAKKAEQRKAAKAAKKKAAKAAKKKEMKKAAKKRKKQDDRQAKKRHCHHGKHPHRGRELTVYSNHTIDSLRVQWK